MIQTEFQLYNYVFFTINLSKQIEPHMNMFLVKIYYFLSYFFVKHSYVLDIGSNVDKKNILDLVRRIIFQILGE